MKLNKKIIIPLILLLGLFSFIISSVLFRGSFAINDNYILDTAHAQTNFYKYGTFTIKGLRLKNGNEFIDNVTFSILDEDVPDMTTVGIKKVIVQGTVGSNNNSYEYYINVRDIHSGDLITLKDESKWYYLNTQDNKINLLSVYFLKQTDNEKLTFMNNDDNKKNIYLTKFNYTNLGAYQDSDIKALLVNKFEPDFFNNLGVNKNDGTLDVELPDALLISELAGVNNFESNKCKYGASDNLFSGEVPWAKLLLADTVSYWTRNSIGTNYAWAINRSGQITCYYQAFMASGKAALGIKPQLIIANSIIDDLILVHDDTSDGSLDIVKSLDYIIYDVDNDDIIREHKSIDPQYENQPTDFENYWGPNTTDYFYPASITKATTVIYALNKLAQKNINVDTEITVSPYINDYFETKWNGQFCYMTATQKWKWQWKANTDQGECENWTGMGPSMAQLTSGDKVTLRDLIYGALYPSGADATMQLAISLYGFLNDNENGCDPNVQNECENIDSTIAHDMTEFVKSNILNNSNTTTNYVNTWGKHDNNNYTTLIDTAKIMAYAMENDTFREIFNETEHIINIQGNDDYDRTITLNTGKFHILDYYVGGKGGSYLGNGIHTGYNFSGYYQDAVNQHRYVVVTAGGQSSEIVSNDGYNIYNWLFSEITRDINSDGVVDIKDVKILAKYIVDRTSNYSFSRLLLGDMNNDGRIKLNDVVLLIREIKESNNY